DGTFTPAERSHRCGLHLVSVVSARSAMRFRRTLEAEILKEARSNTPQGQKNNCGCRRRRRSRGALCEEVTLARKPYEGPSFSGAMSAGPSDRFCRLRRARYRLISRCGFSSLSERQACKHFNALITRQCQHVTIKRLLAIARSMACRTSSLGQP